MDLRFHVDFAIHMATVFRFVGDEQWAETGDRYLLKLLRDYLFHQVLPTGAPWVNLAHIVQTLNKVSTRLID